MSEMEHGDAVLAIPGDARQSYQTFPVNWELDWQEAVVVGPAAKEDYWIIRFADGAEATLHRIAFMPLSFHAQAYGERGQALMDAGIFSDMGMYADSRTLKGAEEDAQNMFDRDQRVTSVTIGTYIQESISWKPGRHLKTIEREAQK